MKVFHRLCEVPPLLTPEVLFHAELAVIPFLIVCTSVLLKMKCKLGRPLLIRSLTFIENTLKLLVLSYFLVHHIFNSLTRDAICWHASSSLVRAHILFPCFSLPLASWLFPRAPCAVVFFPSP